MNADQIISIMTAVGWILWGVSELLSLIPTVKANGVFQAIHGVIKAMAGK